MPLTYRICDMNKNKTLYQLTAEDFQNVALEMLDRELTPAEIEKIADWVADRIPWYDLISDGIDEFIGDKEKVDE
jgi:hypothetical protein